MKTEFVALSPLCVFALILCGFMLAHFPDPGFVLVGLLLLWGVIDNAREPFAGSSYRRGWFIWRRD